MSAPLDARREARAVADALRARFRPAVVREIGTVEAVQRDANQAARTATVQLAGSGVAVSVPLLGQDMRVGQAVLLEREARRPANPDYTLVGLVDPLTPFPALEASFDIPAPTWRAPAITSRSLAPTPGGQMAEVTLALTETPERFGPRETVIAWRTAGATAWQQVKVPNVGGQDAPLTVTLPGSYPLGVTIDAYAWTLTHGNQSSPASEVRSHTVAGDATAPSAPAGVTVDLTINLTAKINLPAPSQPLVFSHWEIAVAGDGAGGAGSFAGFLPQTYTQMGRQHLVTLPQPGTIYLRVREVTRSNVAGPYWPAGSWSGPYTVVANDVVIDQTPPPVPSIQSALASVGFNQNGDLNVTITVTLAAYSAPSDFSHFVYTFYNGQVFYDRPSATSPYQEDNCRPGTAYTVRVLAVDRTGNRSAYSATVGVTTPSVTQPAKPAAPPTITRAPLGLIVSWPALAATTATGEIVGYDVDRSLNGTTWTTITSLQGTSYIDSGLTVGTTYYYRYRARNANGNPGPYSDPSGGHLPLPASNSWFVANQIDANYIIAHGSISTPLLAAGVVTADKLTANLILSTVIRAQGSDGAAGSIYAGSAALLNGNGLTLALDTAIRFRALPLESGAVVGYLGPTTNWKGTGLDGLLIQTGGGTGRGRLFIASNSQNDNQFSMLVSDYEVRQLVNATRGTGFDAGYYYMPHGVRGYLYRPNYVAVGNVTSSTPHLTSGYTYRLLASQMGIVGLQAAAVQVRVNNAGAGYLYVAYSDASAPESGMVLPPTDGHDTGIIELNYGFGQDIYLWSTSPINCYVHVLGYFR